MKYRLYNLPKAIEFSGMITLEFFSSQSQYFALLVSFGYVYFNFSRIQGCYRSAKKIALGNRIHLSPPSAPDPVTEIALVSYQGDCTIAYNMENQPVPWMYSSMKASQAALPADAYFMIRRELIVRGDLIEKVTKQGKVFSIQLKAPFGSNYIVAKKRMAAFRSFGASNNMPWWNHQRKQFNR